MATCTSCGSDVTGKKFCQQCGTPVQPTSNNPAAGINLCPRCNGEVKPGAAFCMHCGSALNAQTQGAPVAPPQPAFVSCPACHTQLSTDIAFCTNCGYNMHTSVAPQATSAAFCTNCGKQNAPGVHFCAACGSQIGAAPVAQGYMQPGQYAPQPQYQPGQQYPQPYNQQQYPQQAMQGGYQQQPMMGQQPMVLRCPVCQAMAPLGTPNCVSCRTSLAGVVPTPATMQPGQQGGLGGFLQGNNGKMAMGALGGAAAVIGGEMLLHGLENAGDRDREYGYGEHRRREGDEGLLGGLGEIGNDLGLF